MILRKSEKITKNDARSNFGAEVTDFKSGLKAFGVGAVAGAVGAATGGATLAAMGGGGIVAGGVSAGIGYTYGTMTLSVGNSMAFGDPMPTSGQFMKRLGLAVVTGGVMGGLTSYANGNNILTNKPSEASLINAAQVESINKG